MAVPKRKTSKMKGRKRRTHYKAQAPTLSICPRCKVHLRPHTACPNCGYYRGRQVITLLSKEEKKKAQDEAKASGKE
ncbi:MAG: 50S ribosomal protein L32 [Deltaproteobacteria bacterium]|jgi:large subunit ribosomal protein L32|nr:50S ribosomal protein L32 [Deltaproteobacteria bacterium]